MQVLPVATDANGLRAGQQGHGGFHRVPLGARGIHRAEDLVVLDDLDFAGNAGYA